MAQIVCILGPTCSGKSALAVEAALAFDGEVISADSMQVYRGLDIGTAKLAAGEMRGVAHHLIDCCDPEETFSAGEFQSSADRLIGEIGSRRRLPIVAGGTGLYFRALLLGLAPVGPSDAELRERLRRRAERRGIGAMHRLLARLDPQSAGGIPPGDTQRILRALEYRMGSGKRLSEAVAAQPFGSERYAALKIGLKLPREELRRRIERRVEEMIAAGLVEEVEILLDSGISPGCQAFKAIGYREMVGHLNGEKSLHQAIEEIKTATIQYAKRQVTWFRREAGVQWIEASPFEAAITKTIEQIRTELSRRPMPQ